LDIDMVKKYFVEKLEHIMHSKCNTSINGEHMEVDLMKLTTERLELIPLDASNLKLSIDNFQEMEQNFGLSVTDTKLDDNLRYAMEVRRNKVLADEGNYLWLTNWAIVSQEENCIVGFIMIKGCPNEFGEVIVGYGIEPKHRRKGYASEAFRGLMDWIFENPEAKAIIADTDKFNIPSHMVLENVGAKKYKETDELIWWRVENNSMNENIALL